MPLRGGNLLDEIEHDALNSDLPIADTLRKVIALGGKVGSTELREWASRELKGYLGTDAVLPSYRKASAVIKIDVLKPGVQITGQQISRRNLPEAIREYIDEFVPLTAGIGEVEAMVRRAGEDNGALRLALPNAQDIANLMNREIGEPYQNINAIYWSLSQISLEGVIDQVRTTLVELVAEMRAEMPTSAVTPSGEVADNAVSIVVYGNKAQVNVASARASGDGAHNVRATSSSPTRRSLWLTLGATAVGLATIAGALIALAQWQGWGF